MTARLPSLEEVQSLDPSRLRTLRIWVCTRHIELVDALGLRGTYELLKLGVLNLVEHHSSAPQLLEEIGRLPKDGFDDPHSLSYFANKAIGLVEYAAEAELASPLGASTITHEQLRFARNHAADLEDISRHHTGAAIEIREVELVAQSFAELASNGHTDIAKLPSNAEQIRHAGLVLKIKHGRRMSSLSS